MGRNDGAGKQKGKGPENQPLGNQTFSALMDFQGYRKWMSLKTRGASKLKFASAKLTRLPLEKALPSKLQQKGLFFYAPCKNVICVKGDKHTNSIPLHPYTLLFEISWYCHRYSLKLNTVFLRWLSLHLSKTKRGP